MREGGRAARQGRIPSVVLEVGKDPLDPLLMQDARELVVVEEVKHGVLQWGRGIG